METAIQTITPMTAATSAETTDYRDVMLKMMASRIAELEAIQQKNDTPVIRRLSADLIREYFAVKTNLTGKVKSHRQSEYVLFLKSLNGRHILDATAEDISNHVCRVDNQNTRKQIRTRLNHFFKYCHDAGYISKNPVALTPTIKAKKSNRKSLTDVQIKTMFRVAVNAYDQTFLTVLFGTGLRISEIQQITPDLINFYESTISIPDTKNDEPIIDMPINPKVTAAIRKYVDMYHVGSDKPIFPLCNKSANEHLDRLSRLANVFLSPENQIKQKVTNHIFRHSFITKVTVKTGNMAVAGKMANQKSIAATQNYFHPETADMRTAAANHPIDDIL